MLSEEVIHSQIRQAPIIYAYPEQMLNVPDIKRTRGWSLDLSSDWDKLQETRDQGMTYNSMKSRLEGALWAQTPLFQRDARKFGFEEAVRLAALHDSMLEDIVNSGYSVKPCDNKVDEYITVLIGRAGHLFHFNGYHRLACCLLSKVKKKIPVKVVGRHLKWKRFKQSVLRVQKRRNKRVLYCQVPHPDLEDIPYFYPVYTRADPVIKHSKFPGGTVLDAGAHWGCISYCLAQAGFDCTAAEIREDAFNFMKRIVRFPEKKFKPLLADFLEIRQHFDTLIIFNIAHHFIGNKNFDRFLDFLRENSFNEIFYLTHKEEGDVLRGKSITYSPAEYLAVIKEASDLHRHEKVTTVARRDLFHIIK